MAEKPSSQFDPVAFLRGLNVPGLDLDSIRQVHQGNLKAVKDAGKIAEKGYRKLTRRQFEMLQEAAGDLGSAIKDLRDQPSIREAADRRRELTQEAAEKTMANAKELSEIAKKSQKKAQDLATLRFMITVNEFNKVRNAIKSPERQGVDPKADSTGAYKNPSAPAPKDDTAED